MAEGQCFFSAGGDLGESLKISTKTYLPTSGVENEVVLLSDKQPPIIIISPNTPAINTNFPTNSIFIMQGPSPGKPTIKVGKKRLIDITLIGAWQNTGSLSPINAYCWLGGKWIQFSSGAKPYNYYVISSGNVLCYDRYFNLQWNRPFQRPDDTYSDREYLDAVLVDEPNNLYYEIISWRQNTSAGKATRSTYAMNTRNLINGATISRASRGNYIFDTNSGSITAGLARAEMSSTHIAIAVTCGGNTSDYAYIRIFPKESQRSNTSLVGESYIYAYSSWVKIWPFDKYGNIMFGNETNSETGTRYPAYIKLWNNTTKTSSTLMSSGDYYGAINRDAALVSTLNSPYRAYLNGNQHPLDGGVVGGQQMSPIPATPQFTFKDNTVGALNGTKLEIYTPDGVLLRSIDKGALVFKKVFETPDDDIMFVSGGVLYKAARTDSSFSAIFTGNVVQVGPGAPLAQPELY